MTIKMHIDYGVTGLMLYLYVDAPDIVSGVKALDAWRSTNAPTARVVAVRPSPYELPPVVLPTVQP